MTSGAFSSFELGTDGPTTILVGFDGSTTSMRAAWYAAGLARRQGAKVTSVYVLPAGSLAASVPAAAGFAAGFAAASDVAGEVARQAGEVSRELGISMSFIAAHGDPYGEILRVAQEIRADAIVVGASAKAGHRLVGSLAVRLVRAGRWPVTVVP